MKSWTGIVLITCIISSCTNDVPKNAKTAEDPSSARNGFTGPLEYAIVPDNVVHDTLLVQVCFDLQDGTNIMVASNSEEKFEGLRLYHYRALPDSSADVISVSVPAYDSWSMLPTFFGPGKGMNGSWMAANFGERESWGQKLFWCDNGFQDRGFIDMAFPERVVEEDTTYLKRTTIAPHMRIGYSNDTTLFVFACDSVYLYDDLKGRTDYVVSSAAVRYTYHANTGLVLWINGEPRTPRPNS